MTEVILAKTKTQFAVPAAGYAQQSPRPTPISAHEIGWAIFVRGLEDELEAAHPGSFANLTSAETLLHDFERTDPWFYPES